MIKGTRAALAAVAGLTLSAGLVAVSSVPAFADGPAATTLTVTASKTSLVSGQAVNFVALVAPSKIGKTKITGSVTWTVTDHNGTSYPCSTLVPLSGGGKSRCMLARGILLAGDAPFTATATYSGDANFASSEGSATSAATVATTRAKIALSAVPTSGAATAITVTVSDGPATALIEGQVVFTVTSSNHQAGVAVRCSGTATPVASNNIKTLSSQVAVCNLPAGWLLVPKVTTINPRPFATWSVSAVYNGNTSFTTSYSFKQGMVRS